jgi:hypothetical protein
MHALHMGYMFTVVYCGIPQSVYAYDVLLPEVAQRNFTSE